MRAAYGRTTYGQGCLLARRLAESGVKFTTCYFSDNIGGRTTTEGGWDTHGFDNTRMYPIIEQYHLPITEQTLPTLLNDLEQRGMLDETLVIWMGEFGRTPKINANASRDHWPNCYSVLLAGGGVKRGYVHGTSDATGSHPAENPVTPDDLAATIHYLLGIDPKTEVLDTQNRPLMISSGEPIMEIIA
jgi:arylsulfatase A-like enzyme